MRRLLLLLLMPILAAPARGQDSYAAVAEQVNRKIVKLFGSGGFRNVVSYGTGIVISPDGFVLTAATPLVQTPELRVHLYDGRRLDARVIVAEPELDAAIIKIDKVDDLPFFDLTEAAKAPLAQPGAWALAFSNQFQIATRDEPLSVQHGVVAAYVRLQARRGVFEPPYTGEVYVVDAITNNPGAAGGALTTRKGDLLGILGRELRNTLTDTWINYAVPLQAKVTVQTADRATTLDLLGFVDKAKKGEYKPVVRQKPSDGGSGYHGILLVPNIVERTPPFIETVSPGSPAQAAGLRSDDLIIYIDGESVPSVKAFHTMMAKLRPGTTVQVDVRRTDPETKADRLISLKLRVETPVGKK